MSPANRFYEVIGAKTLLFYDVSCKRTLDNAGFWDDDFAVKDINEVKEKLKNYEVLRQKQINMFSGRDFREELKKDFLNIL